MKNHEKEPLERQSFERLKTVVELLEAAEKGARIQRRMVAEMIVETGRFAGGSLERAHSYETAFRVVRHALLGDDSILREWSRIPETNAT